MSEAVIAAIIAAVASFAVAMVTNWAQHNKTMSEVQKAQAVTDTKIDELTREVREHNNLVERTYHLEAQDKLHTEQLKAADRRLDDLEKKVG